MALVIDLKPGEKILVADAVITNDSQRTRLHIAGDSPIMREKDVMQEGAADTPCKRIYFLVQCMYMAGATTDYHDKYFKHVKEIQNAAPTTSIFFIQINEHIISNNYYKALKIAKQLIQHEKELIDNATQQQSNAG